MGFCLEQRTALGLLRLGLSLIPVAAKRPLIKWAEFQERRATQNEVLDWLARFPGCDLGIVTGPISGLLVLDVDFKGPIGKPLPLTWSVNTPHGKHHYFKWEPSFAEATTTQAGALGAGLDLRGEGGYVVAPGSAGYMATAPWLLQRIAAVPAWLRDSLGGKRQVEPGDNLERTTAAPPRLGVVGVLENIKEGNRNASFTSIAGTLRRRGFEAEEIFQLLRERARSVLLPEPELRSLCASVARYPVADGGVVSESEGIEAFLRDERRVEWIVDGLIPKNSIGFLAGLPESGKTWLSVDLALACSAASTPQSNGRPKWLGLFGLSSARVLFLDQERWKGETQRRFKACLAGKGRSAHELGDALSVRCGSTTRLDLQPSYDALRRELGRLAPELVIVDSFATFSTADENNRQSIQVVLERVKALRNDYNCTFLFLDHENKLAYEDQRTGAQPSMGRMVGSIAKAAAAEFVLSVRKQDSETSTVYHTKSTMGAAVPPFTFRVRDLDEGGIVVEAL
jgi:hypothetical protein